MKYNVWCPDMGGTQEDAKSVIANDEQEAAEIWADWEDERSCDYYIVGGTNVTVCVCRQSGGEVHTFTVEGRVERGYYAHKELL